jgi:hypothetical protein
VPPGGNSGGFSVQTEALTTHATSVDRVAASVEQARQAGEHVRMGNMAYGLLCQIIPLLLEPLQSAAVDAAKDSADTLRSAAAELRSTASRYDHGEQSAGDLFGGFKQ